MNKTLGIVIIKQIYYWQINLQCLLRSNLFECPLQLSVLMATFLIWVRFTSTDTFTQNIIKLKRATKTKTRIENRVMENSGKKGKIERLKAKPN